MHPRIICVGGAVSYDYLLFPMILDEGHIPAHQAEEKQDLSQLVIRSGSAALVARLLSAAAPRWNLEVLAPALQHAPSNSLKHNASAVIHLSSPSLATEPQPPNYRVLHLRNIGKAPVWHSPTIEQTSSAAGCTVVLTGSGDAFQDVEPALDFLQRVRPKFIIHHMTRPLACGRLWDIIRHGPTVTDGVPVADHLAVIIDANDLRAEGIALSRSLSWEATAEDFVRNLGSNGRLDTLVTCPNLIVRFGDEGVIHHRGRDVENPKLYFYPRRMETRSNHMVGLASAFTAGFALGFPDSGKGIQLGMAATQKLSQTAFVQDLEDSAPEYPLKEVMDGLLQDSQHQLSTVDVPSIKITKLGENYNFSIFEALTGDPNEVSRQIVTRGPERALHRCSGRRFGDLLSFDRTEQESFGAIVDTMNERLDSGNPSPTCIGMIGPVGSGKKFVAKNLSEQIHGKWQIRKSTYNVRVLKVEDLVNACHAIRDNAAESILTVVTFENCEALLHSNQALLSEFVSVMRDGSFKDGGHDRKVGRCVLMFHINRSIPSIAGISNHHAEYRPAEQRSAESRPSSVDESLVTEHLHGVVNLLGPNAANPEDKTFCVRRAFMLRQILKEKQPHLDINGTMKIDDAVLHALLFVPEYKHGLRSLEKIVSTSRLSGRMKFDIAALPPEEQIQLHVDGKSFMRFLRSPRLPPDLRNALAQQLFDTYKKKRISMADTPEKKKELQNDRSMTEWDELPGYLQESTRAQADDIPRKLRAVGCFMLNEERTDPLIRVAGFTEEELDMLAEMEHERFNAERLQQQWKTGPRNSKQRTTPFIIPWRDLSQEWRDVDRVMVECAPRVLESEGYYIYRMKEGD